MIYSDEFKQECIAMLKAKVSSVIVSKQMKVSRPTLSNWLKKAKESELNSDEILISLNKKIKKITNTKKPSSEDIEILNGLITAKNKLETKEKKR